MRLSAAYALSYVLQATARPPRGASEATACQLALIVRRGTSKQSSMGHKLPLLADIAGTGCEAIALLSLLAGSKSHGQAEMAVRRAAAGGGADGEAEGGRSGAGLRMLLACRWRRWCRLWPGQPSLMAPLQREDAEKPHAARTDFYAC